MAEKRDYYEVLGVDKTADEKVFLLIVCRLVMSWKAVMSAPDTVMWNSPSITGERK